MKKFFPAVVLLLLVTLIPLSGRGVAPAPTVIVLSTGEPLLAGSVEAYLEKQLSRKGFDVVDESGIPGVRAWLEGRVTLEEEQQVLDSLARMASSVLVTEATYLGDRPLYYLYRSEPIFQARLKVRLLPFDNAGMPRVLFDDNIEFTHLSLDRAIEKSLGKEMKNIIGALGTQDAGK